MTEIYAYIQPDNADDWISAHIVYHTAWDANEALQSASPIEASDRIDLVSEGL